MSKIPFPNGYCGCCCGGFARTGIFLFFVFVVGVCGFVIFVDIVIAAGGCGDDVGGGGGWDVFRGGVGVHGAWLFIFWIWILLVLCCW